jgi:lauroyl/myristoyl acyltransferase
MLVLGGAALAALGMLYGLHYALFVEHQTLDGMGNSLAETFVSVANRKPRQAQVALAAYGNTKYDYVRQVDAHSHWGGLATLMIVLGLVFDRLNFPERTRYWLAIMLLAGSVLFPFAVLLQTANHGGTFAAVVAVLGSASVTLALAAVAWGFLRSTG